MNACMIMKSIKFWYSGFFLCATCYIISDEKGISENRTVGLGLSMRVLDTLRYALGITFSYPENYDIQQLLSPRDDR
jgi:hypothetical protein